MVEVKYARHYPRIEVNEFNPSFDYMTGYKNDYIQVKALIKDKNKEWKESFKVGSLELAEQHVKEIIKFWNDTLRPFDLPREFISLCLDDEQTALYKDNEGMTGWLTPKGEFIPCAFGSHWKTAYEITKCNDEDVREQIEKNQFISMYNGEHTGQKAYVTILGELTKPQIHWFIKFGDKLTSSQKREVEVAFENQGLKIMLCY